MKTLGDFKKGDSFGFYAKMTDTDGSPLMLDVSKLQSQVRSSRNELYAELTITKHPTEVGTYLFEAQSVVTKLFPITKLYLDIQTDTLGIISSTETFVINIIKDVTRNE